jgi:ABC-type transport system substrate-binding protein
LASVQTSPVFPGLPYRVEQKPYAYDPVLAKQLLSDAGVGNGLKITLLFPTLGQVGNVSQAVAEDYRKIGVELELQPKEQAVWGQLARAHDDVRDMSYNTRAGLGIDFNLNRMFAKSAWDEDNRSRYFNPQVEDLLVKGRSSFDEKVRADTYAEIQRIVWDEAPEVFLFSLQVAVGANPKLANFALLPNAYLLLAEATRA